MRTRITLALICIVVIASIAAVRVEYVKYTRAEANRRFVSDPAGFLSPRARADVERRCQQISRRYRVDVILAFSASPIPNDGAPLCLQNMRSQAQWQDSGLFERPIIGVAFGPNTSCTLYSMTGSRYHVSPRVLPDRHWALLVAGLTLSDIDRTLSGSIAQRTWRGRLLPVWAVHPLMVLSAVTWGLWLGLFAYRSVDGRNKPAWTLPAELAISLAALIATFRGITYYGGWPEAGWIAFEYAMSSLFVVGCVSFNHITRQMAINRIARFLFWLLVPGALFCAGILVSRSHISRVYEIVWLACELGFMLVLSFAMTGAIGLVVRKGFLDETGDQSLGLFGSFSERFGTLDRFLCLYTGKPLESTFADITGRRRIQALVLESSFVNLYWIAMLLLYAERTSIRGLVNMCVNKSSGSTSWLSG